MSHILLLLLAAPATYELDASKTELVALLAAGGLPGVGHPHVVAASQVTGTIVWDAESPESSSVKVSFPTAGLKADAAALRKREGMGDLSDKQRDGVNNNMREDDQLSPKLFPTISFASTSVKRVSGDQLEVTGKLSIRGVEKEITMPVTVREQDGVLTGTGNAVIRHTDFKFKPYSAALGMVKNEDEITLKVKLVGRKAAEKKAELDTP